MESMAGDEDYVYDDDVELYYDNMKQELTYLQSQYAYELSQNSAFTINKEKQEIEQRRRKKIISFYDHYHYNDYNFSINSNLTYDNVMQKFKQNLDESIAIDYQNILLSIRDEEFRRLQKEEMKEMKESRITYQQSAYDDYYKNMETDDSHNHSHSLEGDIQSVTVSITSPTDGIIEDSRSPSPVMNPSVLIPPPPPQSARARRKSVEHMNQSNLLYFVESQIEKEEKEWMKQLKTKKFQIFLNWKKYHKVQIQRILMETDIQERQTKNEIKSKTEKLNGLQDTIEKYKGFRIAYLKSVNQEMNALRDTINMLMSRYITKERVTVDGLTTVNGTQR